MEVYAGKFDQYVEFKNPSKTRNDFGEEERTYSTAGYAWAAIDTRSMNEQYLADKRSDVRGMVINIRQDTGLNLTSLSRFVVDSTTYQIKALEENSNFPRGTVWRINGEAIS